MELYKRLADVQAKMDAAGAAFDQARALMQALVKEISAMGADQCVITIQVTQKPAVK